MNLFDWTILILSVALSLTTAGHALFFKRNPPSALGWVAVCLMFPFVGPVLYFIFGINRVQTRARKLEVRRTPFPIKPGDIPSAEKLTYKPVDLDMPGGLTDLARLSDSVSHLPMIGGNRIRILKNGESAYPVMIDTIEAATERVFLSTYIFDTDDTGRRFIDALARAMNRGVDVCVIVDGVGELYSAPRASRLMKKAGIPYARYLPPRILPPMLHMNLRNHRKMLIADGDIGYTGGMNIGDRHMVEKPPQKNRVADTHFQLIGPVARQLEQTFIEDWAFCTGQSLTPTQRAPIETGKAVCRAIVDGPNESTDILSIILIGAIATARKRVQIMTPYFLPSQEMISALQTTALRGIPVQIVLPGLNNLPFIQWASNNMLWEMLYWGVEVCFQPPPFVHSKLFVIDGLYAQIGSANIDARSLRLNFELNVEIYDKEFAGSLSAGIDDTIAQSAPLTLDMINSRSTPVKFRDAVAWLFSPYL